MEHYHHQKLHIHLMNTNYYQLPYTLTKSSIFMEEAASPFRGDGGLVWPPRSYTCTFCKREFRSAQALGGHMNIHRRDRARLKQQSIPQDKNQNDHKIIAHAVESFDYQFSSLAPFQVLSTGTDITDYKKYGSLSQSEFMLSSDEYSSCCTTSTSMEKDDIDLELRLG